MLKNRRYYITLLDSNYVAKSVAMYESLCKYHNNFNLYVFCFDDLSYEVIKRLNYKSLIAVHSSEFENKELLKCKSDKIKLYEYYWACKPYCILKVMRDTGADIVTYIDCDFMFFNSPEPIFKEIGNCDALIQPNNFSSEEIKQFIPVGYYCTCYESFRNNRNGKKILNWWHKKDMEWCYAIFEPGRFADQKYLDDWRTRFSNVREITNVGANVAPWNVQKYDISKVGKNVYVNDNPLIYYHYHSFKMNLLDYSVLITGDRENYYRIPRDAIEIIYPPYIKLLRNVITMLKKRYKGYFDYCKNNPGSQIRLSGKPEDVAFSSYKEAADRLK